MIIELGMESQSFYFGLIFLAAFFFGIWFAAGRKGGYGPPTTLKLRKGEGSTKGGVLQSSDEGKIHDPESPAVRDVTPRSEGLPLRGAGERPWGPGLGTAGVGAPPPAPPGPPPSASFIYNGHDWDAFEVLGVSPYSSFSEITRVYQEAIKRADPGKHEFLQAAYMAILRIK
ncbi:MAG: hypothetical protein ACK5Y2_03840 [Bdellovibrionales bacterium]